LIISYYIGKTAKHSFGQAIRRISEGLKKEGFGILKEIDFQTEWDAVNEANRMNGEKKQCGFRWSPHLTGTRALYMLLEVPSVVLGLCMQDLDIRGTPQARSNRTDT
jgi:hypothetical protein